jgi:hypothetical protein
MRGAGECCRDAQHHVQEQSGESYAATTTRACAGVWSMRAHGSAWGGEERPASVSVLLKETSSDDVLRTWIRQDEGDESTGEGFRVCMSIIVIGAMHS